jgi:DNA-binding NarL/FixJ family response regulator
MSVTNENVDDEQQIRSVYAELAVQWARQTRAYIRSLRMFQEHTHQQRQRRLPRPGAPADRDTEPRTAPMPRRESALADVAIAPVTMPPAPTGSVPPLTRRQVEIARLIAAGMSNDEIGRALVLTTGTVGNHVGHILRRLGAKNRAQVAAWVTQVAAREPGTVRTA